MDWTFKFIAWLGISASLLIAARTTGSPVIWTITIIAYALLLLFTMSFLDWVSHVDWLGRSKKPSGGIRRVVFVLAWTVFTIGVGFGVTQSVDIAVTAFVNARLLPGK